MIALRMRRNHCFLKASCNFVYVSCLACAPSKSSSLYTIKQILLMIKFLKDAGRSLKVSVLRFSA